MVTTYEHITHLLHTKQYTQAEQLLNTLTTKNATWHYLYGQLMLKKSWFDTAREHFEQAVRLQPDASLYKDTLIKLMGRGPYYNQDYYNRRPYRRRSGCCCCCCCDDCCQVSCCDLICLDCCCEAMGGDLISCI